MISLFYTRPRQQRKGGNALLKVVQSDGSSDSLVDNLKDPE